MHRAGWLPHLIVRIDKTPCMVQLAEAKERAENTMEAFLNDRTMWDDQHIVVTDGHQLVLEAEKGKLVPEINVPRGGGGWR